MFCVDALNYIGCRYSLGIIKGAGGKGAAGAAAPVALMVRGQHGGRKCPFLKPFSYTSEILSY